MSKSKSIYSLPIIVIILALCIMLVFSVFNSFSASAEQLDGYIDIDLIFADSNVYTGLAIEATATVWESEDNINWAASGFDDYVINYYEGTSETLLPSAPSDVGTYTVRAVATAPANGLKTTQGVAINTNVIIKSFTYNIIYNHFAISYSTPSSLVADGNDYFLDVGASIYCEGFSLVEGVDYEVAVLYDGLPTAEVIQVGTYVIEVTMLADFAISNVFTTDVFTYEFIMVASEVSASLQNDKLYYNGEPNAPVILGNITTEIAFDGKYDVFYLQKIGTTNNGFSVSSNAPTAEGEYICRIIFNDDISEYGLAVHDHIDLDFEIVPKPYKIVYQGDGASFMANNAIVQQNPSGMAVTATFTNLAGVPLDITTSDYNVTYWYYNESEEKFEDLPSGGKPTGKGRYQIWLTFINEIPQPGKNTFGSAHPNYKILQDEVIIYEFQIVNPVTYVVGNSFAYTGSPVNISTSLFYGSLPINNSPSQTFYHIRYLYNDVENETAPTDVGSYVGIIRFVEPYNHLETTVAEIGDEYRFYFNIYYPSPTISITYNAGNFDIACTGKESFVEGVDYSLSNYKKVGDLYYEVSDLSGVGIYRTILTIINEDKAKGLLVGDTYVKVTTIAGGNPINIKLNAPNLDYNGNAKPVTPSFGSVSRTINEDYTIKYFVYKNGIIDSECGYPLLPGDYKAVMTFNKADTYFGLPSGHTLSLDYTINAMNFVVAFNPLEGDLVYDKTQKTFGVEFFANNRPVTIDEEDFAIMYRPNNSTDYADFVELGYINAGTYKVAVVFDTDVGYKSYGISMDENNYVKEESFTISSLSVRLDFGLPVEEESMYREGGVVPIYTFYKTNNDLNIETSVPEFNVDYEVDYLEGDILGIAYNEEPIAGIPTSTNRYLAKLTISNANIVISSISKEIIGAHPFKNYDEICYAVADQQSPTTKAQAAYRIIPLPLTIEADFPPESMYEDGTGKGCEPEELLLSTVDVLSGVGGVFDTKTVDNIDFDGLITIEYYRRQSGGTAVIGDPLGAAPTGAGDYTIRIIFNKTGEEEPFVFTCYTIVGGMDLDGELSDLSIRSGYYFDISYRIEEPDEIRVIFEKPASFAYDGTPKAFNIRFASGDFEVIIDSEDYEISYYSDSGSSGSEPFVDVTGPTDLYTIELSFNKNFPQYKIVQIEGVYSKANYDFSTITENDTVSFSYRIFSPIVLDWEWISPNSFYYDGSSKAYSLRFFDADNHAATVTLIYNIDYAIRYYKKVGDNSYSLLTSIPRTPMLDADSYIAELVFLRALPDYRILKSDDETKYAIVSYLTAKAQKDGGTPEEDIVGLTLQDNGGSLSAEMQKENRHSNFNIEKATLIVSGISIQNKVFDNTNTATVTGTPILTIKTDGQGKPMGGKVLSNGVFIYQLSGSVTAEFSAVSAGLNVPINIISGYSLSDGDAYYILEYQALKANINKLNITITPVSTPRQYNPFFVDADNLTFTITTAASNVLASVLQIEEEVISNAFSGALTRVGAGGVNDNVGSYNILIGTLALANKAVTLSDDSISTLADNFTITLSAATYQIVPRQITIAVNEGQFKYYGDDDPALFAYSIVSGSLLFNDALVGNPTRQSGESSGVKDRIGFYNISLAPIRIFDRNGAGVDVTSNYNITRISKPFEVKKKNLVITANNQTITYGQGEFNPLSIRVNNITVTPSNIYSILKGDVFAGTLGLEDTGVKTAVIARRYRITRGTLTIRNTAALDVTHNYNIVFDTSTPTYYTINKFNLYLRVNESATLSKIYGDNDPRITFSVVGTALPSKYVFQTNSTVGRTAGEDVGTYNLLTSNSTGGIRILENGRNVTEFFNIDVNVRDDQNQIIAFAILPREITIGVRNETVTKSNRTILPSLVYYDTDGKELSEDIQKSLKVKYVAPVITYVEGENVLTPVIEGSIMTDDNFIVSLTTGTITIIYPENTITHEPVNNDDILFTSNKIVYSDFRVFNSVKMYQFGTQSGDTPSRSVKASIPITEEFAGKNVYVMAVYSDGTINLLNATIEGDEIVFEDDDFFYILVGTLAIWPYIIVGVVGVVFIGGGAAMLISYLLRRKKRIATGLITPKTKKTKKSKKDATSTIDKELSYEEIEKEVKQETKQNLLGEDNNIAEVAPVTNDSEDMIVTSNISRLEQKEDAIELDAEKTIELNDNSEEAKPEDDILKTNNDTEYESKDDILNLDNTKLQSENENLADDILKEDILDVSISKYNEEEGIVKSSNTRRFEEDDSPELNNDEDEL